MGLETSKHCKTCEVGAKAMTEEEVKQQLQKLEGWEFQDGAILRTYKFKDFYQTMAFVNAVAWVSHRENHHPVLVVTQNTCCVRYVTKAVKGLSENDFICAQQINAILL